MLSVCAFLSHWSLRDEDCDENPEKLIQDLLGPTHITMAGVKGEDSDEALKKEVKRLVPVASTLGGLVLGTICVVSEILGVIGGAQGMLIATSIMYSVSESWLKERMKIV